MKTNKLLDKVFKLSHADDLIIIKHEIEDANVRFANNSITSSGNAKSTSYSLISIIDKKIGSISIDHIDSLKDLEIYLAKSEEIAKSNEVSEEYYPLYEDKENHDIDVNLDVNITNPTKIDTLANKVDNLFVGLDGNVNAGFINNYIEKVSLYTSKGITKQFETKFSSSTVTSKTPDLKKSFWAGYNAYDILDINENELIDRIKGDELNALKKSIDLLPGKYEVILSPNCMVDLLMFMSWMMPLRDADEGRSPFSRFENGKLIGNMIGEKIFPEFINIFSDPKSKINPSLDFVISTSNSSYSSLFDNGASIKKTDWIKNGTLSNLISTREYTAKRGLNEVAFYPYHLNMSGNVGRTKEDLIKTTKKGLYINTLFYIREVDPSTGLLTGLTRDGVYVIEDGKIVGSTNNFRFNQSPIELLKNVVDMSEPILCSPREFESDVIYHLPYLKVKDFNMSSVSEAV